MKANNYFHDTYKFKDVWSLHIYCDRAVYSYYSSIIDFSSNIDYNYDSKLHRTPVSSRLIKQSKGCNYFFNFLS